MPDMERLISLFRELRDAWFSEVLKEHPALLGGRDNTEQVDAWNAEYKRLFDADTEALIRGEQRDVAPR